MAHIYLGDHILMQECVFARGRVVSDLMERLRKITWVHLIYYHDGCDILYVKSKEEKRREIIGFI